MSRPLTKLESTIRDLVRRELRAAPELTRQYRSRQGRLRDSLNDHVPKVGQHLVVAVFLFGAFVASAYMIHDAGPKRDAKTPDDVLLASQAVFLTGGICLLCGMAATLRGSEINEAIHAPLLMTFPVSGKTFRRRMRSDLPYCTLLAIILAVPIYGYLAVNHGSNVFEWLVFGAFLLGHALPMTVLFSLVETRMRLPQWSTSLLILGIGLIVIGAAVEPEGIPSYIFVNAVFLTLPSGWINGALYYSVVAPSPLGVIYLLLTAALIRYFVYERRRPFVIEEVCFRGSTPCAVLLRDGRTMHLNPAPQPGDYSEFVGPIELVVDEICELTEEELRTRLASSNDWPDTNWASQGWLDGLLARRLTARDRAIVENWIGGDPQYTRRFWLMVFGLLGALLVTVFIPSPEKLHAFSFACFGVLALTALFSSKNAVYYSNVFPVGMSELLGVAQKVFVVMAPIWLAGLILTAACVSAAQKQPLTSTLYAAVVPVVFCPPVWSLGLLSTIASGTSAIYTVRYWIKLLALWLICQITCTFLLLDLGTAAHLKVCGVLSLLATVAWAWGSQTFHYRPVDILTPKVDNE